MPEKKTAIGDEAVKRATGRDWTEWLKLLDKAGAKKMDHREIVAVVAEHGVGPWWRQMVTVHYERERGLREVHQQASGFAANVSRTIAVPVGELYEAWSDGRRRAKWLGAKLTIRKATAPKSIRASWHDGTNVDVNFAAKGDGKSTVAVELARLADKDAVAEMKAFWSDALQRLKESLEG